jgi:hypothetical protein
MLRRWAADRRMLSQRQKLSSNASKERWNWDHELEKGTLMATVARALQ